MNSEPILICYDGSESAEHSLNAAAGVRGLTGLRERLEGSVSHQVAEHSRRPVLIVPPHDDHR